MTARSRSAYFCALGIDVWVRRRERPTTEQTVPARSAVPKPTASPPASESLGSSRASPAPVATVPAPEESFRVRCFRYGRVFAAISEDAWPMRRYLVDVAWALNGFEGAQRRDIVFDWPQPGAVADGGGKAFGAFFRHQARTQAETRVLVSGARVATLLGHPVPNESCILNGGIYVRPGGLDTTAKRALWRLIQELDGKT